jgi:NADPH-dependent 2,4-dienoyl-CoA reductase/sulfur reductase-like enzyme
MASLELKKAGKVAVVGAGLTGMLVAHGLKKVVPCLHPPSYLV